MKLTTSYGIKSFQQYGRHLWNSLPPDIKSSVSISQSEGLIRKWSVNHVLESVLYFTALLPQIYSVCNIHVVFRLIYYVYLCLTVLSIRLNIGQWSVVSFISTLNNGELSWWWLYRPWWHQGCRYANLRCRQWGRGRRRGGSWLSVFVFIVYLSHAYISPVDDWRLLQIRAIVFCIDFK